MIEFVVSDRRTAVTLEIFGDEMDAWDFVDSHARQSVETAEEGEPSMTWSIIKSDETPQIVDIEARSRWHAEPVASYRVTAIMRPDPKPVRKSPSKKAG